MSLKRILLFIALALPLTAYADGKQIYVPEELHDNDFANPESRWCYAHSRQTDNFIIFWEQGFGDDLASPPQLDGNNMSVDLDNLCLKLETFYDYYYHTLGFARKGSLCDKFRMMVMINYSLEGTAYGGDYDGVIGALWLAPNRIRDKTLNCIAHELGHCFQSQIMCDGEGEAWGGSGFFEMTSQWMLWQVNPNWIASERYHWDAFCQNTHKAFLSIDNIYRSPFIIEYWGMRRGLKSIADLFRAGKRNEDPVITYRKLYGLTLEDFCDEMFSAVRHIVNLDYYRCWEQTRPYACQMSTKLDRLTNGSYVPHLSNVPEDYGFNVIPLTLPKTGKKVTVNFSAAVPTEQGGFRCGFIVVNKDGHSVYSPMQRVTDTSKAVKLTVKPGAEADKLFLIVMAAPALHLPNSNPFPYLYTFTSSTSPIDTTANTTPLSTL